MLSPELYKLRHHRMPLTLTALGALSGLAPAIYYLFRAPEAAGDYVTAGVGVVGLVAVLLGAVFGGWVLGHEYRQGTIKRVIAADARRGRLLGAKAIAGLICFTTMMATMFAFSLGGAAIAAAVNGDSFVTADLARLLGEASFTPFVSAALAFGASAVYRSDTYATLTSLGLLVVLAPVLQLIPRVGDYTVGALSAELSGWIASSATPIHGLTVTFAALAAWIGAFTLAGHLLFRTRDV